MLQLLQIEWIKLRRYRSFWIMLALHIASILLIASSFDYFITKIVKNELRKVGMSLNLPITEFSDVWIHITWLAVFVRFFLGMLVITMITNEFTYKTARQNIIDGWDRKDFLWAKVAQVIILSGLSTSVVFLTCTFLGIVSNVDSLPYFFNNIHYLGIYFVQVSVYLSFCLLLGILIRRSGLAIVSLMGYSIFEIYLLGKTYNKSHLEWLTYFPFNTPLNVVQPSFSKYIPRSEDFVQEIGFMSTVPAIIYVFVFISLIYIFLKKKDL
ncbi:MAG: hypothetical protein MUC49_06310 [Raineya sp.]|jgi:hypothetical protein|nr:hypothetical protein [Raineya sp.]